ncbi:hypothetical protein ACPDHL_07780 [Myroides sp. C15-4]|uniref:hypothetical protein n=1 Tax=Myroides sp. C15-4 TaxID=3400532 RepID=UPI003D2F8C1A
MTIQELLQRLTTQEKARMKTVEVRELDEEESGCFVAFVDEGEATYDVHLQLDELGVQQMTCDCGEEGRLCIHQGAVLQHIAQKGVKVAPTQLAKKGRAKGKVSASGALLEGQTKETLVQWLAEIFKKNKTLEQQFIVTFSQEKTDYTTTYVADIMEQTFKAVAGKRKTLEGVKIKKILDTLEIAFEPVNDFITVNLDKPIAYALFATIMNTMKAFDKRISHHSKKFEDFYQQYSTWFALSLNNMQSEKQWQTQVKQILNQVFIQHSGQWTTDALLLKQLYDSAPAQQQKAVSQAMHQSMRHTSYTRYDFKMDFVSFFRDVALTHDFYEEVYPFFKLRD